MPPTDPTPSADLRTRRFALGELTLTVATDDTSVVERMERLFAGCPTAAAGSGEDVEVTIVARDAGTYDSFAGGEPLLERAHLVDQEIRLTRLVNDRKLDAEPHLLHLHSAAVAQGDRAALLCARSGSGKSTLTAALVRSGWAYATDEQVAIDTASGLLTPYARPITLRATVWHHFPALPTPPDGVGGDEHSRRMEVAPTDLGEVVGGAVRPAAVVFPVYVEDGPVGAVPAGSAAEVVQRLASCCYDLERTGHDGMHALVRLAALGAAWELRYRELAAGVAEFERLWTSPGTAALDVQHLPPDASPAPLAPGHVRRSPDAAAWLFSDGSALAFHPTRLRLSVLDAGGVALWAALAEPLSPDRLATAVGAASRDAAASVARWVDAMADAGLVERAGG